MKKFIALTLAMLMLFSLAACGGETAAAAVADTGFSDVAANVWYADAVQYARDKGLMSGTSDTTFQPEGTMTRAMLATVLYRVAGSPAGSPAARFDDVEAGTWYSDAVAWASAQGIVTGYGDGRFGTNDPVTREQIATILWRDQGSPTPAGTADAFADQSAMSTYAVDAVAWARENGVVSGMSGNRFAPKSSATRAQVATILKNLLDQQTPDPDPAPAGGKTLVVYFSATGSTKGVAEQLQQILNADVYEIVPQQAYTSADLNYNDANSRVSQEHADRSIRPSISSQTPDLSQYDVIFLGYPIWWGQAPNILLTFLERNDLSGKTVVLFCTSASSDIGSSASALQALSPNAAWKDGQRFSGGASQDTVRAWVESLGL